MMTNLREVYIARFEMSSPNQTAENREIDDMHKEITLQFPKEIRDRIASVRNKYRALILKECVHFHGLQVVGAENRQKVSGYVEQADADLRAIDPQLHAQIVLIPVSVDAEGKGALYTAIQDAIKGQVYSVLLDRLKELAKKDNVPMRSRNALLDLCDRMKAWNVLGDPNIEETITSYQRLFKEGILKPVAEEVEKVVAAMETAAAFVEL